MRHPEFRNKPLCVCIYSDRGGDSGAVTTANYIARKYGVRSGLSIYAAQKLLKDQDAHFLPVDFDYISDISERAMDIMQSYADIFEYVGRDEAYLDVTERADGAIKVASHLAQQIKMQIRKSLGMTCSAGVSYNKLLSKMASNHKKPDGLTIIYPNKTKDFLGKIDLKDIHGLGKKTLRKLESMKVYTISDAETIDVFDMQRIFGRKMGTILHNSIRGIDDEPVQIRPPSIQYGKLVTLSRNMSKFDELKVPLYTICDSLHGTISEKRLQYRTVTIQFIHSDMSAKSRSKTIRNHTASVTILQQTAITLLREALQNNTIPIRRLGVKVSNLSEAKGQQDITSYF